MQTRRGVHFLYRVAESTRIGITSLRPHGLEIDLKFGRSVVIAPPSRHAVDPNFSYAWVGCTPDVIDDLPPFNVAALHCLFGQGSSSLPNVTKLPPPLLPCSPSVSQQQFRDGSRGLGLNDKLVADAWACESLDELLDLARTWNAGLRDRGLETLDDAEIFRRTKAVWRDTQSGMIERWHGQRARTAVSADEIRIVASLSADAFALLMLLRSEHGARAKRGETFAISINAMVKARVLGRWSARRLRKAREILLADDYIRLVREALLGPSGRTSAQYMLVPPRLAPAIARRRNDWTGLPRAMTKDERSRWTFKG